MTGSLELQCVQHKNASTICRMTNYSAFVFPEARVLDGAAVDLHLQQMHWQLAHTSTAAGISTGQNYRDAAAAGPESSWR